MCPIETNNAWKECYHHLTVRESKSIRVQIFLQKTGMKSAQNRQMSNEDKKGTVTSKRPLALEFWRNEFNAWWQGKSVICHIYFNNTRPQAHLTGITWHVTHLRLVLHSGPSLQKALENMRILHVLKRLIMLVCLASFTGFRKPDFLTSQVL